MIEPDLVADFQCETGEGPIWHEAEQRLYWVDIPRSRLFRYDPASGTSEVFDTGEPVGGFTVQQDGALLLFMARGAVRVWHEGKTHTVINEIPEERENRFNDVIADPEGRVFCGTMPLPGKGARLYRLDPDRTVTRVLDGVALSNGMGFTPDLKQMYYTDTRSYVMYRFDYDRTSGALANRQVFARVPEDEGKPDGMTVDAEGFVWSARWNGGRLVRYSPQGEEVMRVDFPAPKVSCVTFGGPDYRDMYVTTAGGNVRETDGDKAGALFRVNFGIRGRPEFLSRIEASRRS